MSDTAVAAKPAPAAAPEIQPYVLKQSEFAVYGHRYERLTATVPAGTPFEDALRPGFWTNIVHHMKRNIMTGGSDRSGCIVELRTEDHAWYAEMYVRGVLERGLIVQCAGPAIDPRTGKACPVDLQTGMVWGAQTQPSAQPSATGHLSAKWNPGKRGFDIIRADGQIVADGREFPTREQADEWIAKATKA